MNNQSLSNMDKRRNNGGARIGAGRKSKAEEIKLVERLTPLEDDAIKALTDGVKTGNIEWIKLYMSYYVGKPKDFKEITINEEQPLFID